MNEFNGDDIEDLSIDMTETSSTTITEADIVLFAGASGDNNAVHINVGFDAQRDPGRYCQQVPGAGNPRPPRDDVPRLRHRRHRRRGAGHCHIR
jgi:hypothetical protein